MDQFQPYTNLKTFYLMTQREANLVSGQTHADLISALVGLSDYLSFATGKPWVECHLWLSGLARAGDMALH